jgi:hypothetical protein
MSWTLDNEVERFEIVDADQLRQHLLLLHEHARERPEIVTLNAPDGSCLAIGLGRNLSVMNYIAPGGWPARHVVGHQETDGLLQYRCFGQHSEIPSRNAVPIDNAIDAAVELFSSGQLTEHLRWEND